MNKYWKVKNKKISHADLNNEISLLLVNTIYNQININLSIKYLYIIINQSFMKILLILIALIIINAQDIDPTESV